MAISKLKKSKKKVVCRELERLQFTKVIFSFSHIRVCLINAVLAFLMLFASCLSSDMQSFRFLL